MAHYGRAQYWEQRYSRDVEFFDWYQRYFSIRDIIGENIPVESRILNVGSGNSTKDLVKKCLMMATNLSPTLTSLRHPQRQCANFKYIQMDVRAMDFPENSFDAIIDKGTFDSVVSQCGEGSNTNANKMLSQIYRVLSASGVYIMITFGSKQNRLQYLEKAEFDWGIKVLQLPKPTVTATITQADPLKPERNNHFIYVCTKGKKSEPSQPQVAVQQQKK